VSLALFIVLAGCGREEPTEPVESGGMWSGPYVRERRERSFEPPPSDGQVWPATLSDAERERLQEAAWTAVTTQEIWARWFESPETPSGVKLSRDGIRCSLPWPGFAAVLVAIPSGGMVGWHATYVGVICARGSGEVLDMHSGFWP
jgi:hypothetical protein